MSLFRSKPTEPPTASGLRAGRIFTATVFVLTVIGMIATLFADGRPDAVLLAQAAFAAAALIYLVAALVMYDRGDYILRMFGCAWPIILAKADELQRAQRQRAFSFTFIVFLTLASFGLGAHVGALFMQRIDGEALTGILPADPIATTAVLIFVFFMLTLLPQAYLAWTLKPLDREEAE